MAAIAMIAAQANNRVIGVDNTLPWHVPADFAFFKATTMGKPMVMGRKTFDSIGKALPGRTTIVVTRDVNWQAEGVLVELSLEAAVARAQAIAERDNLDEIMVVGGASLYAAMLDQADRIYLTDIHVTVDNGDAYFPELAATDWQMVHSEYHEAEGKTPAYSFKTYDRIK